MSALTALITLILEGRTPAAVCSLLFGAKLTALMKENGGIRPIAVGCTIGKFQLIVERLHHLHAHDALTQLRHSFSIPKLLHVLHTSPAFQTPLLISWGHLLLSIVSKTMNINCRPDNPCWLQATLLVWSGGLGIRRASLLAPLPFWPQLMEPIY